MPNNIMDKVLNYDGGFTKEQYDDFEKNDEYIQLVKKRIADELAANEKIASNRAEVLNQYLSTSTDDAATKLRVAKDFATKDGGAARLLFTGNMGKQIGDGTVTAISNARKNALEMYKNGTLSKDEMEILVKESPSLFTDEEQYVLGGQGSAIGYKWNQLMDYLKSHPAQTITGAALVTAGLAGIYYLWKKKKEKGKIDRKDAIIANKIENINKQS